MSLVALSIVALAATAQASADPRLVEPGPDFGRGVLINASCGARPNDPLDPARPTFIIVHGLNPMHPLAHFSVGPRYAEALRGRFGSSINIAYWDWNSATTHGLSSFRVRRRATNQGEMLGATLAASGIAPENAHLIGQSAGCVLVASAVRRVAQSTGRLIGRVTLIDPAWQEHELIFERLQATRHSRDLDHYWVPGPSGFGAPARYAGVRDYVIPGPNGWRGLLRPSKLDHLHAVAWHISYITR